MGLTEDEKGLLAKLTKKAEEPDEAPIGKSVSFSLDLGDDNQVKRAVDFGLLPNIFGDKEKKEAEGGKEGDDVPNRKGYFGK